MALQPAHQERYFDFHSEADEVVSLPKRRCRSANLCKDSRRWPGLNSGQGYDEEERKCNKLEN
jgi:hypothetical protein